MSALATIFWTSVFIIFYTYLGYPLLIFLLVRLKKLFVTAKLMPVKAFQPHVALVVAAYNEEDVILSKIHNTLELDYPPELLTVIFITDGSTDKTPHLITQNSDFTLMHQPERRGKAAAINRAMQTVTAPVTIFCDANTLLNRECIAEIVKHYSDPIVGGVAGEKKILKELDKNTVASGEGLYWEYESFTKTMDSQFYSVVGAAGELFSIKTSLYQPVEEDTIIEDFVLSLRVCLKGFVVRYESGAYAIEAASISMKEEQKRKSRISAGGFQAMVRLAPLFNIFRYPRLSFQFISHRVLRWTLCPLCLVLSFILNFFLLFLSGNILFTYLFFLQLTFYLLAVCGWVLAGRRILIQFLSIPYYFIFMNVSVFIGFYRMVTKKQSVLWEKAERITFH